MSKQLTYKSGFTIIEMLATISVIAILSSTVFLGQRSFNSRSAVRVRADDILSTLQLAQTLSSGSFASNIGRNSVSAYAVRITKATTEDPQTSYRIEKIPDGVGISNINDIKFDTFNSSEIVYGPDLVEKNIKFTPCFIVKSGIPQVYVDDVEVCYDSKENLPEGFFEENKVKEVLVVFVFPFREPTVFFKTVVNKKYPSKKQFFDGNNKIIGARRVLDRFLDTHYLLLYGKKLDMVYLLVDPCVTYPYGARS